MTSTLIERKFTHNTIMRVMMIFFATVFMIPMFISTTYKPFASEHEPFLIMFKRMHENGSSPQLYRSNLDAYVNLNKDLFDPLIRLEGPDYLYSDGVYDRDEIRDLETIKYEKHGFKLVFSF